MSDTMEHVCLAELAKRYLATSANKVDWLAARVDTVTATEAATLMKGGAGAKRALIEQKIKGDSFRGNKFTEWGSLREAAIAQDVRARTAIEPNLVLFHALDNKRHAATPDGTGVTFAGELQMSEIKTSKYDLTPGPVDEENVLVMELVDGVWRKGHFWSTVYYWQMQWQMYVTGAVRTRFTWEQHDDDWSEWPERGPRPIESVLPWCWVLRDDAVIAQMVELADDFLVEYDAALRDAADGVEAQIDDELDTLAVNLLRFRALEAEGKKAKETTWKAMQERLEGCDALSQKSALVTVTYSPGEESTSEVLDAEAAKAADPELFAEVQALSKRWNEHAAQFKKTVVTPAKSTLTVTAVKAPKEKKA